MHPDMNEEPSCDKSQKKKSLLILFSVVDSDVVGFSDEQEREMAKQKTIEEP